MVRRTGGEKEVVGLLLQPPTHLSYHHPMVWPDGPWIHILMLPPPLRLHLSEHPMVQVTAHEGAPFALLEFEYLMAWTALCDGMQQFVMEKRLVAS